jgi:uncharacterized surface protein with fasciclin (FAS1) repeats
MNTFKKYIAAALIAVMAVGPFTSCSDDIPSDSYYTFKGEMLSDYLRNRPEFSDFATIVQRAGKMDLLSTYGRYTCFAPTNDAVQAYLSQRNISLSQLSDRDCDTIASTAIVEYIYGTSDFIGVNFLGRTNMLGRNLSVEASPVIENGDTINTTYRINRTGLIIMSMANDSVENGIVHPVSELVVASNLTLPTVMAEDPNISIFNTCLALTGLDKEMLRIEDTSYDPEYWRRGPLKEGQRFSGAQWDYCHVPESRRYGYTAFAVPDSILNNYADITRSDKGQNTYDKNIMTWEDLYDYACTVYPEGAGQEYYDKEHLTDPRNPLYRLIGYHLLNRKGLYDKLYTYVSIYTGDIYPTEWYTTMAPLSTIKVEMVNGKYASSNTFTGSAEIGNMYLNRHYDPNNPSTEQRGAIVNPKVADGLTQLAVNGVYYYIDRLVNFGEQTQQTVFNTRMRMDLYTFWPEMMNNDLRSEDCSDNGADIGDKDSRSPCYVFPNNYFDEISLDDGEFLYQNVRCTYWSYEGDEFNLRSNTNSFDMTFNLPTVPDGDYQIRLGFAPMDPRAVAQIYLDGMPQGIPLDMRSEGTGLRDRIGWIDFGSSDRWRNNSEEWIQNKKDLHNQGWYHGPGGVRQGTYTKAWDVSLSCGSFVGNDCHTMRRVIYQGHLSDKQVHTMRIKSVYAAGTAHLMIDYLEIVPKSIYGVDGDGRGEDDL